MSRLRAPRARELGVPFEGEPGPLNALTDVAGVEVGHVTLVSGEGPLRVGEGPVRTGVTAVHPRGGAGDDPVFAGVFVMNGNGELTGAAWIEEAGVLAGPVALTNTHSVGAARDAIIAWQRREGRLPRGRWSLPVVGETYDGWLNDIDGFHVRAEHVHAALDSARGGSVEEGAVGAGTGTLCHGFKGGIGTASRRVRILDDSWTVAVLAQCNHGSREQLRVAGVPVGLELTQRPAPSSERGANVLAGAESGSIVVLLATDAPLLPHQLRRLARRGPLGVARNGAIAGNGSGDFFVAFSTANRGAAAASTTRAVEALPEGALDPLFTGAIECVEEAIVNALVAAETMTGAEGHVAHALPHEDLRRVLRNYRRLV